MTELKKENHPMFAEYYVGTSANGQTKVTCILDNNCVRYIVSKMGRWGWKVATRREYGNEPQSKARCFQNATKALN